MTEKTHSMRPIPGLPFPPADVIGQIMDEMVERDARHGRLVGLPDAPIATEEEIARACEDDERDFGDPVPEDYYQDIGDYPEDLAVIELELLDLDMRTLGHDPECVSCA